MSLWRQISRGLRVLTQRENADQEIDDEVKDYLRKRQAEAAELRREIESRQPGRAELRAKLLARRERQEHSHASAGG